jgi:hypothetical protein
MDLPQRTSVWRAGFLEKTSAFSTVRSLRFLSLKALSVLQGAQRKAFSGVWKIFAFKCAAKVCLFRQRGR